MTEGDKAWLGLALYVISYDLRALLRGHETLSSSFSRAIDHPLRRWPTILAWAYITLHLFRLIPRHLDPLRRWTSTSTSSTPPRA